MFRQSGIVTLCLFKSTPEVIARYGPAMSECSFALSDKKGKVSKEYMIPKSNRAIVNGVVGLARNYGKFKSRISFSGTMGDARLDKTAQLPADFMIDEDGVIVDLIRGEHMPFERIEAFIPEDKRCRCNKKDCIVS